MRNVRSWLPLASVVVLLALLPMACSDSEIQAPDLDVAPAMDHEDRDAGDTDGEDDSHEAEGANDKAEDDDDEAKDADGEGEDDEDEAEDDEDEQNEGRDPFDDVDLDVLASFERGAPPSPELANTMVGPEGGSVRLGEFEVVVPPGAVDRRTLFQIRRPVDRRSRDKVLAEFRPHRSWFGVPVTVRFPLAGTDLAHDAEAGVIIWDEREEEWLRFPTSVIEGGARIEAQVPHLSVWGISAESFKFYGVISSGGD